MHTSTAIRSEPDPLRRMLSGFGSERDERGTRLRALAIGAAVALLVAIATGFFAQPATAAEPGLVGEWTFDDATGTERTGNWSTFALLGDATVSNGELAVSGSGN